VNVLLIAYAFPPYPIVGSIRAERLAGAFADRGHEVHVLTARLPAEEDRLRSVSPSLTVETVPTVSHPFMLYRRFKGRRSGDSPTASKREPAPPCVTQERWEPPARLSGWKRHVLALLRVPDELQGFIPHAVPRGARAFCGRPDLIYTTSPPHSAHLAALAIHRITGARWVAEFRDPWVGNAAGEFENPLRSKPAEAMNRWLESQCLRRASRVVAVTNRAGDMIRTRMPEAAPAPLVVLNGIDVMMDPPGIPGDGPFRILYVGGLGSGRDPRPFLRAVEALVRIKSNDVPPPAVRVDLVGNCRYYGALDLRSWCRDRGLSEVVHFTDWVDHVDAQVLQVRADLLLLLAQHQPAQVPNKLYEYFGAHRPILALVDHDGESATMLRRVGGHFLVTEREGWDTSGALRQAVEAYRDGRRFSGIGPDLTLLQSWTVEQQMAHLLSELGM
jgi:hypothetical protein